MKIDLETFSAWVEQEVAAIPPHFKQGVNNFFVDPKVKRHPSRVPGLFILGHFHTDKAHLGTSVTLYYGSFRQVFRSMPAANWRREIAATIMHELLHHWEHRSGYDALGEEDREQIRAWQAKHPGSSPRVATDMREILMFLFIVGSLVVIGSILVSR